MTQKYTIKNVTEDLTWMVGLTNIFVTDESGYWVNDDEDNERFVYKLDANDTGKEIVLFQDPLPREDVYFFNPYAEGFGKKSPATTLYFNLVRAAFVASLGRIMLFCAEEMRSSKDDASYKPNPLISKISANVVDKKTSLFDVADEKFENEVKLLLERSGSELAIVRYISKTLTASVKFDCLSDPHWDEKFGKDIRKKSLIGFKTLLRAILGIEDESELDKFSVKYDPALNTAARFYTMMSVFLKLYTQCIDLLELSYKNEGAAGEMMIPDLTTFNDILQRSHLAYAIAKHMVQPVMSNSSPTDLSPANTNTLSLVDGVRKNRFEQAADAQAGRSYGAFSGYDAGASSRFKPHVIGNEPVDPFAPLTRPNPGYGQSPMIQPTGFGYSSPPFVPSNNAGYGFGGGLNTAMPSNYGSPMSRQRYF